jgi:hypothetical protein
VTAKERVMECGSRRCTHPNSRHVSPKKVVSTVHLELKSDMAGYRLFECQQCGTRSYIPKERVPR